MTDDLDSAFRRPVLSPAIDCGQRDPRNLTRLAPPPPYGPSDR